MPAESECEWFSITRQLEPRQVRTLSGLWSKGNRCRTKVGIELNGRLTPVAWAEALLESNQDVLVARLRSDNWAGSQFISVANGSFLLNLPLVNHEHRKLAGRLVSSVGSPRKQVAFLQSDAGGPPIIDREPDPPEVNALDVLGVWPLGGVLLHLAALGVIFAFARWPIFGRPLLPLSVSASDFGKHRHGTGAIAGARPATAMTCTAKLAAPWQRGEIRNSERGNSELGSRNSDLPELRNSESLELGTRNSETKGQTPRWSGRSKVPMNRRRPGTCGWHFDTFSASPIPDQDKICQKQLSRPRRSEFRVRTSELEHQESQLLNADPNLYKSAAHVR